MDKENPSCLSKTEVFEFQKRTISRIADYVYDLEDILAEAGTDLQSTKKEMLAEESNRGRTRGHCSNRRRVPRIVR